jgi:hypothetical protein
MALAKPPGAAVARSPEMASDKVEWGRVPMPPGGLEWASARHVLTTAMSLCEPAVRLNDCPRISI